MKICIVSQIFAPQAEGGAEISTRHAALNLSANHDIVVLALGKTGDANADVGEMPSQGPYRVHRVNFHNLYLPSQMRPKANRLVKGLWHLRNAWGAVKRSDLEAFFVREKFDLIYAQNSSKFQPALYEVAKKLNIPICQHLRDYALLCPKASMYYSGRNHTRPPVWSRILTHRARSASRGVQSVIAVSDFVKSRFLENGVFRRSDFHVLHNTNTSKIHFDAGLLERRPAPQSPFTVGYLGALSPEKGVETLLAAFAFVPRDLPARLIVGGRGNEDYVAHLHRIAANMGERVLWLGHVTPETIYRQADVIAVPSLWHEPQSRILIEAATYGIPVFAARTGGSPEVVEGYKTGWCYEPTDVHALAEMMNFAITKGPVDWRTETTELFPGLQNFRGTAEASRFYTRLEEILELSVKRANQ